MEAEVIGKGLSYTVQLIANAHGFNLNVSGYDGRHTASIRIFDPDVAQYRATPISPIAADLLDLAAAIQSADRLCLRGKQARTTPHGFWSRQIHLVVPVRHPEIWNRCDVQAHLTKVLSIITDDVWHLDFNHRLNPGRRQEQVCQLGFGQSPPPASASVVLFSGGIDSTFALNQLLEQCDESVVPLTVTNSGRIVSLRDGVLHHYLNNDLLSDRSVNPIAAAVTIDNSSRLHLESSARARGAQFILTGAAVAIDCNSNKLLLSENSIGAIGLPMTSDHFGARASKTIHPLTLSVFSQLVSSILNHKFQIENIGLRVSKRQMVESLSQATIGSRALSSTSTCDVRRYRSGKNGCGRCTSCVLRIAAFAGAGVSDPIRYPHNFPSTSATVSRGQILMQYQAAILRGAISSSDPIGSLLKAFPQLSNALPFFPDSASLFSLLKTHVDDMTLLSQQSSPTYRIAA